MSSTVGERQSLEVYSLNALLGLIWSVNRGYGVVKVVVVKHIDAEVLAIWCYAQNDVSIVSADFADKLFICRVDVGMDVCGEEILYNR